MFNVKDKKKGKITTVYDVQNNSNGFPMFLIHDGKSWKWESAKFYIPITDHKSAKQRLTEGR